MRGRGGACNVEMDNSVFYMLSYIFDFYTKCHVSRVEHKRFYRTVLFQELGFTLVI